MLQNFCKDAVNLLRVRLSANLGAKATDAVTGKRQGDVPRSHIWGTGLVAYTLVILLSRSINLIVGIFGLLVDCR